MDDDTYDYDQRLKRKFLLSGSGDSATRAYIANKYLGTDEPKKKKKIKTKSAIRKGNLGIVDEDTSGWITPSIDKKRAQKQPNPVPEGKSVQSGVFVGRTDNWETVQEGEDEGEEREDEKPMIVTELTENELRRATLATPQKAATKDNGPKMSSGQRAGLLTSQQIQEEAARAREAEKAIMMQLGDPETARGETVYRDETGRKIDPKIKRAEEARARREALEKEEMRMEWGKGLVQRREAEAKLKRLQEEKNKPMAIYKDDAEYNQLLKDKQRWNDPAAGFLTNKPGEGTGTGGFVRPTYKGAWKPNRFMIAPGYRWDGVDRSNGYEDQFLLRMNQKKAQAIEAHAWSTEDM